jgi:hypothetical protein
MRDWVGRVIGVVIGVVTLTPHDYWRMVNFIQTAPDHGALTCNAGRL